MKKIVKGSRVFSLRNSGGGPSRDPERGHRWIARLAGLLLGLVLVGLVGVEAVTSRAQAYLLGSQLAPALSYQVERGPSPSVVFPADGPFDLRYGYTHLPRFVERLSSAGYRVEAQTRVSPAFRRLVDAGLFPVYRQKGQTGLHLLDRRETTLFRAVYPEPVFSDFEAIPALVRETLFFIENRGHLDPRYPHRNPAVDWGRLARASAELALFSLGMDRSVPGASTLATQMEKFRHSPRGLTDAPSAKLRQMATASVRAYLEGEETVQARRRIVTDYLNSVPLAAIPGHGEVIGLGEGLRTWYGIELEEVNRLLAEEEGELAPEEMEARAVAYRQVLSLLLAQRRPSWYLVHEEGRERLKPLTDAHLRLLAEHGIITPELRDGALDAEVRLQSTAPRPRNPDFVAEKAANSVRTSLLSTLSLPGLYDLDRLDLTASTTIDARAQTAITELLHRLTDPEFVGSVGLREARLLQTGDPSRVRYAVTVYERTAEGAVVRVETDNFDGPFNVNRGTKLDLGSTAKLRTLVHYLEVMEGLYQDYRTLPPDELRRLSLEPDQVLARWTAEHLAIHGDRGARAFLEAALDRRYSAHSGERFLTGGGVHTFRNFDPSHDARSFTVREAFAHSVNLPFIRLMRDLVRHHVYADPDSAWTVLRDPDDPRREEYLARFAEREGRQFMTTFHQRLRSLDGEEIVDALAGSRSTTPLRLARIYRSVRPGDGVEELAAYLRSRPEGRGLTDAGIAQLHREADPTPWTLADLGYLAGVHPLEIQVARHLTRSPGAPLSEVLEAGRDARLDAYRWLFRTRNRAGQDRRIRELLEVDAFREIHRRWARLGYPFPSLVPSYATAVGTSADRPEALAELAGILLNDGIRPPTIRIRKLSFAEGTPYEAHLGPRPRVGTLVLSPAVAATARDAMALVVSEGSGRRMASGVPLSDGRTLRVSGKTGTGDHTHKVFASGGRLVEERPVNRTATFVFTMEDRFFGAVTVFVSGEDSGSYAFTSSLPVQILRMLGPALENLVENEA